MLFMLTYRLRSSACSDDDGKAPTTLYKWMIELHAGTLRGVFMLYTRVSSGRGRV
jgi:hypothetical protein